MIEKYNLANVAYTKEYLTYCEKAIEIAFHPENKTDTDERQEIGCRRIIEEYCIKQDGREYFCSFNHVFDSNGSPAFEYTSLYDHPFFAPCWNIPMGSLTIFTKKIYMATAFMILQKRKASATFRRIRGAVAKPSSQQASIIICITMFLRWKGATGLAPLRHSYFVLTRQCRVRRLFIPSPAAG